MFIKVFIQTKILCFRLNCYVFNLAHNYPLLCKRRHNLYSDLLRQNWMFRLSENSELRMEEIHHHVL